MAYLSETAAFGAGNLLTSPTPIRLSSKRSPPPSPSRSYPEHKKKTQTVFLPHQSGLTFS